MRLPVYCACKMLAVFDCHIMVINGTMFIRKQINFMMIHIEQENNPKVDVTNTRGRHELGWAILLFWKIDGAT